MAEIKTNFNFPVETMNSDNLIANQTQSQANFSSNNFPSLNENVNSQTNFQSQNSPQSFGNTSPTLLNTFNSSQTSTSNAISNQFDPANSNAALQDFLTTPEKSETETSKKYFQFSQIPKKFIIIGIVVFVVILIVVIAVLFLRNRTSGDNSQTTPPVEIPDEMTQGSSSNNSSNNSSNSSTDSSFETNVTPPPEVVNYSTELANNLSLDMNQADVATEFTDKMKEIEQNILSQNITAPVNFIITDANNQPIDFHQFVIATKMSFPESVLSQLSDNFEIFAYNDSQIGVRFGFVVETLNSFNLQDALRQNEQTLPQSLSLFLGNSSISSPVVFSDNVYYGKNLRFVNLPTTPPYTIDYSVYNGRWFVATSKNSLRAIFDKNFAK